MLHGRESGLRLIAKLTAHDAPAAERATRPATYSAIYAPARRLRHFREAHAIFSLEERRLKLVLAHRTKHSWIADLVLSRLLNHPDGGLTGLVEEELGEFGFMRRFLDHLTICFFNIHLTGCKYLLVLVLERCKPVIEQVVSPVALIRPQAPNAGRADLLVGAPHIGNSHGPVDLFVPLRLVGQI